ncbi:hypothetical protein GCM10010403_02760 [Glycomyces rutgersensis]|uniref:Uncharacterized protein n=1 Tax=Glycomyces rutgersensis TaxID=58115 RepID=A0ABN3F637_9ACTN
MQVAAWILPVATVDRVVNAFPQEQVTSVTTYSGWIPSFMTSLSPGRRVGRSREPEPHQALAGTQWVRDLRTSSPY